jgi:tRNA1Val (adenine37-N6)-methyltransferase
VTSVSRDSISLRDAGIVSITQQKKGVRFTLDSLLLADFCRIKQRDRVLEPGAGTGIISLLLAKKFPNARFVADELEPGAYELLIQNIKDNALTENIKPINADICDLTSSLPPHPFDVIVANPPYTKAGAGRTSPFPDRQLARLAQTAPIDAWLDLKDLLKNKGRYFLVLPASRAAELVTLLRKRDLEPKRLRFVHPSLHKPASLALVEAIRSAGIGLDVLPPLIVHEQDGGYTEEVRDIYGTGMRGETRKESLDTEGAD